MSIKKVSIIGLGALGVLFGNQLSKKMSKEDLRVIADQERIARYENEKLYCNGEQCDFHYVTPEEECGPADLLIFSVKSNGLEKAIQAVNKHVGEHTIIISLLNGITSENIIGETYGMDKIVYCVAQGMDAVKVGNKLTYDHMGMLCFGARETGVVSENAKKVAKFFEEMGVSFELDTEMRRRQWGKFMLNVGVNQTVAVYKSNYGEVQREGEARETMIAAMREVIVLSEKADVHLTDADLNYWLMVLGTLSPNGKPSMAQDVEAGRFSEVELFAGTVIELGEEYRVSTPINQELYSKIKAIESHYTIT